VAEAAFEKFVRDQEEKRKGRSLLYGQIASLLTTAGNIYSGAKESKSLKIKERRLFEEESGIASGEKTIEDVVGPKVNTKNVSNFSSINETELTPVANEKDILERILNTRFGG
jgi:hypothetical protein